MAKFYGRVGYSVTIEADQVWQEKINWRPYYGDVTRSLNRWDAREKVNDDVSLSNTISIVADPYAYEHFFAIRCVEWQGQPWKVTSIEVQRPRIILTLGGLYEC